MDKHYTVSQATEMNGVKAYVLRYWEDEMELRIGRNEMGHQMCIRDRWRSPNLVNRTSLRQLSESKPLGAA